jgi:hypothetical protein
MSEHRRWRSRRGRGPPLRLRQLQRSRPSPPPRSSRNFGVTYQPWKPADTSSDTSMLNHLHQLCDIPTLEYLGTLACFVLQCIRLEEYIFQGRFSPPGTVNIRTVNTLLALSGNLSSLRGVFSTPKHPEIEPRRCKACAQDIYQWYPCLQRHLQTKMSDNDHMNFKVANGHPLVVPSSHNLIVCFQGL